jgi:hypothetical protein
MCVCVCECVYVCVYVCVGGGAVLLDSLYFYLARRRLDRSLGEVYGYLSSFYGSLIRNSFVAA